MKIAMIGTRGVPAHYGGFETAIEEIGSRLAAQGEDVVVFCRPVDDEPTPETYRGMRLVWLPALRKRSLETLSHTALSVLHRELNGTDAAIVFNAANSPFLPVIKARGIPVATHVDGLEWRRSKWGAAGRKYYRMVESYAVRASHAIIADAPGIADYYAREFGASSRLIAYGAPDLSGTGSARLAELGLSPDQYHLVVARFEPENHVLEIVQGYVESNAALPLVVVGSAPYSGEYSAAIEQAADHRVTLLGGVWDQDLLDQLYANAATYLHGHSVGGTNPSLLRAAGAGTATIAFDSVFNRGVIGETGWYFRTPAEAADRIGSAERNPELRAQFGEGIARQAAAYSWDQVAEEYLRLCQDLADGYRAPSVSGRRKRPGWSDGQTTSGENSPGAVVVAHPSPDLYGSDRVLLETLSGLVASGEEVILTLPEPGPLVAAAEERGVRVEIRPTPILRKSALTPGGALDLVKETVRAWGPSASLLRESSARLLVVNTVTIPLWLVAGKLGKVKVVCHVHEAEASQPGAVRKMLYAPLNLADQLIVNSRFSLSVLASSWPRLRGRSSIVYNGVEGPGTEPAPPRRELDGPVKLLFVGRLSPRKGPQVAIDALAELRSRGVDAELGLLGAVFPGYEWFEQELYEQVERVGVAENVVFHGFERKIWDYLADADIILVPSTADEPFGNTAVEAMLAARPVVVSDTSGLREAARGFASARYVTPNNSTQIVEAAQDLISAWSAARLAAVEDRGHAQARHAPSVYQGAVLRSMGLIRDEARYGNA